VTIQKSTDLRDAQNDLWESILGTSPTLELRTGAPPASCAAADSGTLVASMSLPADFMSASSGGVKSKLGTWQDPSADAAGVIGHFRLKTSGGTCKIQGTVTLTAGGGDMTVDNTNVQPAQLVSITSFSVTAGGA
jgi:hypothetical protein